MCRTEQRKGQSLVEFALVVPIILLLMLGTFDLAFAVYANNTVSLAAREGARYAVTRRTVLTVDQDACQRVTDSSAALAVGCTIVWNPGKTQSSLVTVTATYTYTPLTPLVGSLLGGGSITFTGQSTMVAE